MKKLIFIFALIPLALSAQDIGGDYYVAHPDSTYSGMGTPSDSNDGSYANPWATIDHAFSVAVAGDTVYYRGGTYYQDGSLFLDNSGTSTNKICHFEYPGEEVVIDCINNCEFIDGSNVYNSGIYSIREGFIHLKGFHIRNVFQCDSVVTGGVAFIECANLTFENMELERIGQRGFYVFSGGWAAIDSAYNVDSLGGNPENNRIIFDYDTTRFINCDVHELCDTFSVEMGNAADGWKCHTYEGTVFEWTGCRVWHYSDDGFDPSGAGKRIFNNCWAMAGGKYLDVPHFEGNGIKTSGIWDGTISAQPTTPLVVVRNCLAMYCASAFKNAIEGDITQQNNAYYVNNTAFRNQYGFVDVICDDVSDTLNNILRNNISYGATVQDAWGNPFNVGYYDGWYEESNNTWERTGGRPNFQPSSVVTVSDADFVTTDSSTLVSLFVAERGTDYSLPTFPLRLVEGSDLINAGTTIPVSDSVDFQISYSGTAPDIGAFESNYSTTRYKVSRSSGGKFMIGSDGKPQKFLDTGPSYGEELHTNSNAAADPNGTEANATSGFSNVSATLSSVASPVSEGSYAISIEGNTSPVSGCRAQWVKVINISEGSTYRISFDVRHVGTGGDWEYGTNVGSFVSEGDVLSSQTTYQSVSFNYTATAAAMVLDFRENNASNNGGIYIDNLSVKEIL